MVGDHHIGGASVRGDVQLPMAFEAFHTAHIPLILLAYG